MSEVEEQLRQQIEALQQELEQKEKNLHLAGSIGKELLTKNEELTEEMEKNNHEYSKRVETLEQEKYSLQQKVSQKLNLEEAYTEETDNLRAALERQKADHQTVIETEYAPKICSLGQQLSSLQLEIEKHQLLEEQLKEQLKDQDAVVEDYKEQLAKKIDLLNETSSEELSSLHSDINKLQSDKMGLNKELTETRNRCHQLSLETHTLTETLILKDQEVEEKQCHATSYYNALERSREETQELRMELDMIKMNSHEMKKKGNSLFAEVEDKRVEAEKELIKVRVQFESLQKQHEFARQQLQKMKMQMATLLMMSGGRADEQHLERQQQQLSKARAEIESLLEKIAQMEKRERLQREELRKAAADSDDKNYSEYLLALMESKEKEVDKLNKELNSTRLLQLAESQRLVQCQRNLHTSEKEAESLKGAVLKWRAALEEMQLKYEPESLKGCKKEQVIKEKIPLSKPEAATENEVNSKENNRETQLPKGEGNSNATTESREPLTTQQTQESHTSGIKSKKVTLAGRKVVEERIPKAGAKGEASKSCLKDTKGKKSFSSGPKKGALRPRGRHGEGLITEDDCKTQ